MNALILVDLQNDFSPAARWPCPTATRSCRRQPAEPQFDLIVATQDWHPPTTAASRRTTRAARRRA